MSDFPDAATVADQLGCSRQECMDTAACWTRGGCIRRYRPDPKGREPRIRDSGALRRKVLLDRECRVSDCGSEATDPHHIVFRSDGGDDVEDNIIGLCRLHHDILHFSAGEDYWETRHALGVAFTDSELRYVLRKLGPDAGADYLRRAYGVPGDRLPKGAE